MNVKQTGGSHYEKMKYQPIDFIITIGADFPTGCVIKYISRYKEKNGAEDLQKAIDNISFMEKYDGYQMKLSGNWRDKLFDFVELNNMDEIKFTIFLALFNGKYQAAKEWIKILRRKEYGK